MNNKYDLVVVGRGLAGHGIIDSYMDKCSQIPSVLWIGKNPLKKDNLGCSISSTAMVARQGIVKGLTPLGDLLVDSFEKAIEFTKINNPHGVESVTRYHYACDEDSFIKLKNRFGDQFSDDDMTGSNYKVIKEKCLLFEPKVFLSWWTDKISKHVSIIDDFVTGIKKEADQWEVTIGNNIVLADKVVLATGASGESFFNAIKKPSKIVPGHYLSWRNVEFDRGFVLTIDGHNLMYRKNTKSLVLSGTSVHDGLLTKKIDIYNYLDLFIKHFPHYIPKSRPILNMGMRQKGKKRIPYFEEIDTNLFQVDSLYKNGYSFCHELGNRLSHSLI